MPRRELPWHKEYAVFGWPRTLAPYPEAPVHDILDQAAKKFPATGLIQDGFKLPYPEVLAQVDRLATALADMGLGKGDRVASLLPSSIPFVIADYAIGKAGCVHVPASSLEPIQNLVHKFEESRPRVLICLDQYMDVAKQLAQKGGVERLVVFRLEDYSEAPPPKKSLRMKKAVWAAELIEQTGPNLPRYDYDVEKDLETLLFTGGTTGLPKGCMITHRGVYSNALQNLSAFGAGAKMAEGAIAVLLGLPFFHSYGHIIMHTMTLMGADQILVTDPRDTAGMVDMINTYYPVVQFGVPTQFMKIAQEAMAGRSLIGMSGSAPLPPATQEQYEKKSGGGIMEGYGLSEMGPATHVNPSFLLRLFGGRTAMRVSNALLNAPGVTLTVNSVLRTMGPRIVGDAITRGLGLLVALSSKNGGSRGKSGERRGTSGIPLPDTEVRLLDPDTGEPLSPLEIDAGKPGELCMRGPQRMLGYWPEPGTGLDDEGYVRTGDVVVVDDRGYFTIVDRTKDMIVVSGYKVYSRELEDMLYEHPDVDVAAIVGVPDPYREGSERVVAYVQPRFAARHSLAPEDVTNYLKDRVAKYAVPKMVRIVDEIPTTGVHKVDKKAIRADAEQEFQQFLEETRK
ncbi:MAG: class I adenylate-forming enzyme family protein [Desulfatibacillaceae bacterium]